MRRGMPLVLVGVGIAVMGAIVQVGACTKSIEDRGISTCGPTADDGNPCTIEVCEGSAVTRETAPPDTNCQVGDTIGKCNNGECQITCAAGQCPALTKCQISECANGTCVISNKPMGPNPDEADAVAGDCLVPGCYGAGKEVEGGVPADQDRPADENCVAYTCEGGLLKTSNVEEGNACTIDTDKLCESSGECVTCIPGTPLGCVAPAYCHEESPGGNRVCSTCDNGEKEPDESDVDCGGLSPCQRCELGKACAVNEDCRPPEGIMSSYCIDNVCCNSACVSKCYTCDLPGFGGMCSPIPPGNFSIKDKTCLCDTNQTCDMQIKSPNGTSCGINSHCASGLCVGGYCKQPANTSCVANEDCGSNSCVGNVCQP